MISDNCIENTLKTPLSQENCGKLQELSWAKDSLWHLGGQLRGMELVNPRWTLNHTAWCQRYGKKNKSLWKDLSQFRTQVADTDDTVLNSCTCWMSSSNYQTRTMTIRSQRCAIRMISAGQWLDFLQHQTSPTSEKRGLAAALWSVATKSSHS